MRKILPILFFVVTISSCGPTRYVQLLKTQNTSEIAVHDYTYIYENDTVKITYDFWHEHGVLLFSVYNKLSIPLYIDWRKSSYVRNSVKLDYWADTETVNATTEYETYTLGGSKTYYTGGILPGQSTISASKSKGTANTTSVKTKPERITFIAPQSMIDKGQFTLFPASGVRIRPTNAEYYSTKRNDDTTKPTVVIYRNYDKDETLLNFRNFLTMSTTEDFKNEFYIDNGFFLNRVSTMDVRHFENKKSYPYEDSRNFYIYLDDEGNEYFNRKEFKNSLN